MTFQTVRALRRLCVEERTGSLADGGGPAGAEGTTFTEDVFCESERVSASPGYHRYFASLADLVVRVDAGRETSNGHGLDASAQIGGAWRPRGPRPRSAGDVSSAVDEGRTSGASMTSEVSSETRWRPPSAGEGCWRWRAPGERLVPLGRDASRQSGAAQCRQASTPFTSSLVGVGGASPPHGDLLIRPSRPSSRTDRGPRGELVPRTATEVADQPSC